jgi:hypothetical protein
VIKDFAVNWDSEADLHRNARLLQKRADALAMSRMTQDRKRGYFLADMTGKKFGRLTAQWPAGYQGKQQAMWLCLCTCGQIRTVRGDSLRNGSVSSCGCSRYHGHASGKGVSLTYNSWRGMLERCENPKSSSYEDYGQRGITVCDSWHDFKVFLSDMGPRPRGKTLDRNNPNGNYEPSNCQWATPIQQANNKRSHHASE